MITYYFGNEWEYENLQIRYMYTVKNRPENHTIKQDIPKAGKFMWSLSRQNGFPLKTLAPAILRNGLSKIALFKFSNPTRMSSCFRILPILYFTLKRIRFLFPTLKNVSLIWNWNNSWIVSSWRCWMRTVVFLVISKMHLMNFNDFIIKLIS